jgi:hypothetical protein
MLSSRPPILKLKSPEKDKSFASSRVKSDKSPLISERRPETINIDSSIQELIYESTEKIANYNQMRKEYLFKLIMNLEKAVEIKTKNTFRK